MTKPATIKTVLSIRTQAAKWELCNFNGGKTEVYREYPDTPGLFEFLGYVEDGVFHHLPSREAADLAPVLEAHEAARAAA
jgi:hypothetical protein